MVLKQCIACNHRVPAAKKICVCGHVFTRSKMIGGKRYSGYRAMLNSRSVPKGKRAAKKSNCRLMIHEEKKVNKRLGSNSKKKQRLSNELTRSAAAYSKQMQHQKWQPEAVDPWSPHLKSPELLEKLNDALDDINKRIARQSLLWIVLKSSKY